MAYFAVHISTDGAAFGEDRSDRAWEVARILRTAARKIENGEQFVRLRDSNGNRVGFASFHAADEDDEDEEHDESEHALDDDADAYFDRA